MQHSTEFICRRARCIQNHHHQSHPCQNNRGRITLTAPVTSPCNLASSYLNPISQKTTTTTPNASTITPNFLNIKMARRRRPPRPGALTELPPLKILSQILILQAIYYTVAFVLILFTALVAGRNFSFDMILSWRSLRGDTTVGWMLGLVWMLNSFIGYVLPLRLTRDFKLIPDIVLFPFSSS